MPDLNEELAARLRALEAQGLYRRLRRLDSPQSPMIQVDGRELLNFSSNDYLGLATHPQLKRAAIEALDTYGVGSGASRLICGSLAPHHQLEATLAAFKRTEAALTFSSGYATALGTICALVGPGDVVILDRLAHACLVDAARLSRAQLRVFAHNDLVDLEKKLASAASQTAKAAAAGAPTRRGTLIVTESVFSMDGDFAPLRDIVELKDKYGAWLMLDEAHATGIWGTNGSGLAEASGLSDRIEVQMGTLGKALGASGGYIAGSRSLIDFLINRARTFIFSTAPPPAAAAAATAAIQLAQTDEGAERRRVLNERIGQLRSMLTAVAPKFAPRPESDASAIVPLILGAEEKAVEAANRLLEAGVYVPAIRYPTVRRGQARLRLTLTAGHQPEELARLGEALQRVL